MKIIKNDKRIERYGKIGKYVSMAGLIAMLAILYFWIQMMTQAFTDPESISGQNQTIMLGVAIVAIILSSVGSSIGKRYGSSPRPDEKLDAALKGLPVDTTLYHYMTPASHLLVGPMGIWVLVPSTVTGKVTYSKKRWRNGGGGFFQGYLRIFGMEGIGRPELDAEAEASSVQRDLAKKMETDQAPLISSALIFTENVELDPGDSPIPAMKIKQLKEFMRQKAKERLLSPADMERIKAVLPQAEE